MSDKSAIAGQDRNQPPGLREKQKARRRNDILRAGRDLFFGDGYFGTSMEAVAQRAEVGVATVYNYFGTKGQLLSEIVGPDFDRLFQEGERLLKTPPEDPETGMLRLIGIYQRFENNWENREALKACMGPGLSAEPVLDEIAANSERQLKRQLAALLSNYQKIGSIRPEIDIEDAATIIFYIFNQHFIEFVTQADIAYAPMKARMDRHIGFIVKAIR